MITRFWRGEHRNRHDTAPREPLFADSRRLGMTLRLRVALLVLLATAFMIGLYVAGVRYVDSAVQRGVHRQKQIDEQSAGQAALNRRVAILACLLVEDTPPGNETGDRIRAEYHCPAYRRPSRPPSAPSTSSTSSSPHANPSTVTVLPGDGTSPSLTPSAPVGAPHPSSPRSHGAPTATRTRTVTRPGPTTTRSTTVTGSPGGVCVLLPLLC